MTAPREAPDGRTRGGVNGGLRRNWINRYRETARGYLTKLLVESRHCCHWCGEPLIEVETIPPSQIVRETDDWVEWQKRPTARINRRRKATIDHIKPISEGGTNYYYNLAASCGTCNRRRNKIAQVARSTSVDGSER